jgi:hypothetical protein
VYQAGPPEARGKEDGMGFHLDLQFPNLSEFQNGFVRYWMASTFTQSPWGQKTSPLVTAFMRTAETTLRDYEYGRHLILQFLQGPRPPNTIPIGQLNGGTAFLEACITNMHRATECLKKIRSSRDVPDTLKILLPTPLAFVKGRAADKIREMRHEVQHFERRILSGTQPEGTKLFLTIDGPQRKQGSDTIKVYDRLAIGEHEILLTDLAEWLREMAKCALVIAENR